MNISPLPCGHIMNTITLDASDDSGEPVAVSMSYCAEPGCADFIEFDVPSLIGNAAAAMVLLPIEQSS